jgi:hypothetical protein
MEPSTEPSETFGYTGQVRDPRVIVMEANGFKLNIVTCCYLKKDEWGLTTIRLEDVYNMSCKELAEHLRRTHHGQEEKGQEEVVQDPALE